MYRDILWAWCPQSLADMQGFHLRALRSALQVSIASLAVFGPRLSFTKLAAHTLGVPLEPPPARQGVLQLPHEWRLPWPCLYESSCPS